MLTGFQPRQTAIFVRCCSFLALCLMGGFSLIEACPLAVRPFPMMSIGTMSLSETRKGFLVKENDLDALTQAVVYLLDHPAEAEEMGVSTQKLAFSRHHISKTSEMKKDCYRELLVRSLQKVNL